MSWLNRPIGELAVRKKLMNHEDVERVLQCQTGSDALFGELAMQLGLLNERQLNELVQDQAARRLRVGESLVELGYLTDESLKELLNLYLSEEQHRAGADNSLPMPLARCDALRHILEQLPKVALRSALIPVKIGRPGAWEGSQQPPAYAVAITLADDLDLDIGLGADREFGATLSRGRLGLRETPDEATIVTELTGLLENAIQLASPRCEIGSARPGELPASGFAFEVASPLGRGQLIVCSR